MHIRNPAEWGAYTVLATAHAMRSVGHSLVHTDVDTNISSPEVRRISFGDLGEVLRKGLGDFGAYRTHVIFLCLIYPFAGLAVARVASDARLLPLLFPLALGFALIGPFAAVGLYEMSRRRERGEPASWRRAFGVFTSPAVAAIFKLGLLLTGFGLLWVVAAMKIYALTLGPDMPTSVASFARDVFTTPAGWTLIVVGLATGFLFALVALATSVVSFPLLLDRHVSISTAIATSVRAVRASPGPMLAWGGIVAAGLALGTIPLLMGLIVVMPALGHATWHLYRKVVV